MMLMKSLGLKFVKKDMMFAVVRPALRAEKRSRKIPEKISK